MIIATVTGNLGKNAAIRDAGGTTVCSFGVASTAKIKGEKVTTWVECSIWGKRGENLAQYLTKGTKVAVIGELSTREYDGKTYLQVRVDQIDLMGGGERGGGRGGKAEVGGGGGYSDADYGGDEVEDDLPF
jgi:single-strand DNA-binding protein